MVSLPVNNPPTDTQTLSYWPECDPGSSAGGEKKVNLSTVGYLNNVHTIQYNDLLVLTHFYAEYDYYFHNVSYKSHNLAFHTSFVFNS